ncbi:MAG TPA: M56 family metallopeptidase, partial [Vicinamibacterales bacterium]|nr:M56 family metallopeptidase [Vicinamibacterales bacterium]
MERRSSSRDYAGARAAVRHLVFALAFTALVAIPVAHLVLPTVAVAVPVSEMPQSSGTQDVTPAMPPSAGRNFVRPDTSSASRDSAPTMRVSAAQLITATWLAGVVLFLMPVIAGLWQVRRLRQRASPWTKGEAIAQTLAATLGVQRPIDALLHDEVTGPMTCGLLEPAIILPASAQDWDDTALRCALRHELEHVARWDFLTHCLSRIVCAAYWFHPLVWAAWRRLRLEAERACDDAVVREDDAGEYALLLVSIAQQERTNRRRPLLTMAGRDDLAARVGALLDDDHARGRVGRRRAAASIVIAGIATLGVAPLTVARAMPQTQATGSAAPRPRFETASLTRNQTGGPSSMSVSADAGGAPGGGSAGRVQWLKATNVSVRALVWFAYSDELREDNGLSGPNQIDIDRLPQWVDSDRFDLVAKAPSPATREQMNEMTRSFLVERFKLETHRGSKAFPIYALVLADGSPGPRMTTSQIDCRSTAGEYSPCGLSSTAGRLSGRGVTMA